MVGKRSVWRRGSYSTIEGNCVEVVDLDNGGHAVRDSNECAAQTGPRPGTYSTVEYPKHWRRDIREEMA